MKPQEPVLFIDNKKPFRVKQGSLGDCWFIVGLVHLEYYPNLFKFIVSPYEQTFDVNIYAGIFHFRFWQAGIWVDVVIDDRLPTEEEELVYASSGYPNEFWPALIEKAYAKLMYRSYKKLDGGFSRISMQDLSGGISETYIVKATSKILFKIIQDAKDRSTMISCGTRNENKFKKLFGKSVFNIGPGHSYAVTSVKIVKGDKAGIIGEFRLIRIRDPYGEKSVDLHHGNIKDLFTEATLASKLDTEIDEESWILYDDFVKYFSYVEICNLTPNQITNHVYSNTGKKLALSAIEGKFMGAVTSEQVAYNDFFTINPQYRMVLTKSDEVLIGVSLKRRHDVEKISISRIFFEIISFDGDDTTRVPQPLFTSFIEPHKFGPFKSRGQEIFCKHALTPYSSVEFSKLKNLFDAFDYELTYNIIATIFQTHGNDVDIFYHQFVQSVVDVTLIFEKIQKYSPIENGENLNKVYHKMFDQLWKNKQEKKYKRQADEPADNESTSRDEPSTSKTSTELQRIPSDRSLRQIQVENVQLTEYKNGEMIELQQQDFFQLRKEAFRKSELFRDPQFPKELFIYLGQEALRPKDIVIKPQEPVLFIDNKRPFHVKQGELGDCWFLVGLLNLQYHPNLFKFIVQPYDQTFNPNNYAGIFHFRFWQAGTWVDVVIDDRLPTEKKKLIYTSSGYSNEFWPALIEKAYAKLLYRSYEKLPLGFPKISMQDLSGGISETYIVKATSKILFKIIQDAKDRSTMISCATLDEEKFKKFGTRVFSLHPRHGYAVTSVKIVKGDKAGIIGEFRLIRIRDPYGEAAVDLYHGNIKYLFTEATLKSKLDTQIIGESWILYDDFIKYFSYIDICNLTPNQIIGHVYSSSGKKLALSAIEGKFMGAVTTKQKASNDFFTVNPQYRMVLKKSDGVLIGVSLKRRHDLQRAFNVIYFRIMSFDDKDTSKLPKPLLTSSIGAHSFGIFTFKGQVGQRIDLEPGSYCEEFHAKLCKDLVLMVHDDTTTFNDFNEPQIHELRINEQQFNVIIKFIKNLKEIFHSHASKPYFSVAFAKLKDLFDAFDYKLTYNIIATIFQSHGNDVDIFYNQFVQSVVDVTLIFEKIQKYTSSEKGENLNKVYHKMFEQLWQKKQEKKYSIENNKRQADEPAENKNSFKKIKI
ncbi:hypothetical protein HCN44_003862 [Aphidius gifuensis]|uniref:Calpain catalytic domain-containing protein n=1 Tax=Aphidius gifuensis TaxID=684658 RepID=A0A834XYG8_APHGI|nr:hypothetical protein HCN44_003862 [Aphidius gifuensis]